MDSTLFHNSKQWTLVFNRNHYVISSYYDEGAKFVSIKVSAWDCVKDG